jgi:AcrR family transcriptional regulator
MTTTEPVEGLRARKKRERREAIAAAAMALFLERGFDAVTVADIARAADVAEKTVYNYFPAKEDLVFRRGAARRAELIDALRALPPGASVVLPFRRKTDAFLDGVAHGPVERLLEVPRIVRGSVALRDRLFVEWEQEAIDLAPVIAEAAGRPPDRLEAIVVARTLAWTDRLAFRAAAQRLLAGEQPAAVAEELREQAREAYDTVERGLGSFRVPA